MSTKSPFIYITRNKAAYDLYAYILRVDGEIKGIEIFQIVTDIKI